MEEEIVEHRPKRARVGRPAQEILDAVNADTPGREAKSEKRDLLELLLYLGRPSRAEPLAESMRAHTTQLANSYRFGQELALECLFECAESMSTHTPMLAAAVAVVHKTTAHAIAAQLLDATIARLQAVLQSGDTTRLRLLLRLLASLAAVNVASAADVVAQFNALLSDASKLGHVQGHAVVYTVLAALPWMANSGAAPLAGAGLAAAGDAAVAALLAAAAHALDALAVPTPASCVTSSLSLASLREGDPAFCWTPPIDAHPADAARLNVPVGLLASPPARVLLSLLQDAVAAGGISALAVPSIARPQDDAALCRMMGLAADGSEVAFEVAAAAAAAGGSGERSSGPKHEDVAMAGEAPSGGGVPPTDAPTGDAMAEEEAGSGSAPKRSAGGRAPNGHALVHLARVALGADGQWHMQPAEGRDASSSGGGGGGVAASGPAPSSGRPTLPSVPPHARWHVRQTLTIFGHGGLSGTPAVMKALGLDVPAASPLAVWAVRETAADVVALCAPLHSEAAKVLLRMPMGRGRDALPPFSAVPLAVEAVLVCMLELPRPSASTSYHAVLLLDLFRLDGERAAREASVVPSTLGLAMRVLWKYLPVLDGAVTDRLASWLAHHVSNTKFAWPWGEWVGSLPHTTPPTDPHKRFLTDLLQKTFALVGPYHYDRILREAFPPEYAASGLIPAKSLDAARSELLSAVSPDAPLTALSAALAGAVTAQLRAKTPADALREWVLHAPEATAAGLSAEARLTAFAHAVLMYGKSNLKNAATLFDRYHALFTDAAAWGFVLGQGGAAGPTPSDLAADVILSAVQEVWHGETNVASALVDIAVTARVVSAEQAVRFCLEPCTSLGAGRDSGAALHPSLSLPAHRIGARLAQPKYYALVHATLLRAEQHAHQAGVDLALYRGSKVYDEGPKDFKADPDYAEQFEDAAAAKEADMLTTALRAGEAHRAAVLTAVAHGVRAARALQAHLSTLGVAGRGGEGVDPPLLDRPSAVAELLRLSLSNTRRICREHAGVLRSAGSETALAAALEASAHLRVAEGAHHAPGGDLGAALVLAAMGYVPHDASLPPALVRDALVPSPAADVSMV